jgi:hypothetical protein
MYIGNRPLSWDGSCLGELTDYDILFKHKFKDDGSALGWWEICPFGYKDAGVITSVSSLFPCICNRMKSVLGIKSTGMHWFLYKTKYHIIRKPFYDTSGDRSARSGSLIPISYGLLKDAVPSALTSAELFEGQKIQLFKLLMGVDTKYGGIYKTPDNCLESYEPIPLDTDENVLRAVIKTEWFNDSDQIVEEVMSALTGSNEETILSRRSALIRELERTITEINPDDMIRYNQMRSRINHLIRLK